MIGPGDLGEVARKVLKEQDACGIILMVFYKNGDLKHEIQGTQEVISVIPKYLERAAKLLRQDMKMAGLEEP